MNVGTLTATVLDASLDPATSDQIRPGRKVRLMAKRDGGDFEPLFTGTTDNATVTYDLRSRLPANLVTNPSFATNLDGWTANYCIATWQPGGSAQLVASGAGRARLEQTVPVEPDTDYVFSAQVKIDADLSQPYSLLAEYYTDTDLSSYLGELHSDSVQAATSGWVTLRETFTTPADCHAVHLYVPIADATNGNTTDTISLDKVSVFRQGDDPRRAKRARISLTATDANRELANTKISDVVATIAELPYVIETAGVPWNCDGSSDQVSSATVTASRDGSVLDAIAIARDTQMGHAWVDRYGVLQAWTPDLLDSTERLVLDESVYSATSPTVAYNMADSINSVTVSFLIGSDENPHGPYLNAEAISEWGARSAPFTITGATEVEGDIADWAQAVLDANSEPLVHITQASVPIRFNAEMDDRLFLDLLDLVAASNDAGGLSTPVRIERISHEISSTGGPMSGWLVTYGLMADGFVASPQALS